MGHTYDMGSKGFILLDTGVPQYFVRQWMVLYLDLKVESCPSRTKEVNQAQLAFVMHLMREILRVWV